MPDRQRFEFRFAPRYQRAARPFGVTPRSAWVEVSSEGLEARYGPWRVNTPLTNIKAVSTTGPYRFIKTAGPARLAITDRGVALLKDAASAPDLALARQRRPVKGRSTARAKVETESWEGVDRVLFENVLFGAICRLGRMRPEWIPRLARLAPGGGRSEYVEASWRVFTSPRLVHFVEMEYSIPRDQAVTAVQRLRQFVDDSGLLISFPVEVRFTAADDIPLSTGYGRPNAYIAVHVFEGTPFEQYFSGVEAIMDDYDGRPHWGKLHYQTAATLAPRYPEWDTFQAVRARLDPDGRFRNAYLDRVLG